MQFSIYVNFCLFICSSQNVTIQIEKVPSQREGMARNSIIGYKLSLLLDDNNLGYRTKYICYQYLLDILFVRSEMLTFC